MKGVGRVLLAGVMLCGLMGSVPHSLASSKAVPELDAQKTGGDSRTWKQISEANPDWARQNQAAEAGKLAALHKSESDIPSDFERALGDGSTRYFVNTPIIGQGQVRGQDRWAVSPWNSSAPVVQWSNALNGATYYPIDARTRVCTHCGATSALIALRHLAEEGRATASDLSADDAEAIFQLGVGYYDGYNTFWYSIQGCCDDSRFPNSRYYNRSDFIARTLDDRTPGFNYLWAGQQSVATFEQMVRSDMIDGYPIVLGFKGNWNPYGGRDVRGHIVVVDGYWRWPDGSVELRINDPNDCGLGQTYARKYWVPLDHVHSKMQWLVW